MVGSKKATDVTCFRSPSAPTPSRPVPSTTTPSRIHQRSPETRRQLMHDLSNIYHQHIFKSSHILSLLSPQMPPTRKRQRPLDVADPNASSKPPKKALKTDSRSGSQAPRPDPICNYALLKKTGSHGRSEPPHPPLIRLQIRPNLASHRSRRAQALYVLPQTRAHGPRDIARSHQIREHDRHIARLEEQDKKKQEKWSKAAARNPPISKEDAAK
jgi:hypothetical protein